MVLSTAGRHLVSFPRGRGIPAVAPAPRPRGQASALPLSAKRLPPKSSLARQAVEGLPGVVHEEDALLLPVPVIIDPDRRRVQVAQADPPACFLGNGRGQHHMDVGRLDAVFIAAGPANVGRMGQNAAGNGAKHLRLREEIVADVVADLFRSDLPRCSKSRGYAGQK